MAAEGRRVAYDKVWGGLLLLTCVMPYRLDGESSPWQLFARGEPLVKLWLLAGTAAGLFAVIVGFAGWRRRRRHLINFLLGVWTLTLPMLAPAIWRRFPYANPAELPLGALGSVGWVMLVALVAVYAGSGIRIVRPSLVVGQTVGGLGALVLAVFAFLPMEGSEQSFAYARLSLVPQAAAEWRKLASFFLFFLASAGGIANLVRSKNEVWLARLTRIFLVAGVIFWLAMPFLEEGGGADLHRHLPRAWGGIRLLAPLFLCLDGAVAFLAISITRSND